LTLTHIAQGLDKDAVKELLYGKDGSAVTIEIIGLADSEKKFVTLIRVGNSDHSVHVGLARLVRRTSNA
jgi:hypothetical protein